MRWNLESTYLNLPEALFTAQSALPVTRPRLAVFNVALAAELGLGEWDEADLAVLGGNADPPGSRPFAQAYAGHQYGHFTRLGDGRALVLGEHRLPGGGRVDLQLKGSGRTPYSRRGDGRAALGPMLREYLIGEAFHALGIPTTRALAVVETGEALWRDGEHPGAVLTRVAASHIRVGTFEFAAATGDPALLAALADYTRNRHFPQTNQAPNPALALLEAVVEAQASLVARWMAVGFVHGVMNTDNMALSGQSLDFGPCAFLDAYRADQVFSSIDEGGRYAYGRQPVIAGWNLARFAETLLPLIDADPNRAIALAQDAVHGFAGRYEAHYHGLLAAKLGLASPQAAADLAAGLLEAMEAVGADYTLTFRAVTEAAEAGNLDLDPDLGPGLDDWVREWNRVRLRGPQAVAAMDAANPRVVPRNHRVNEALDAAEAGDWAPFHELLDAVTHPYELRPGRERFAQPPSADEAAEPFVTYCGT